MEQTPKRAIRRKKSRFLTVIKVLAVFLFIVTVTVPAVGYYYIMGLEKEFQKPKTAQNTPIKSLSEVKMNEPANILVVGSDQREDEAARSDTIMVVRMNPEQEMTQVVSIPRDSRVKIPGYARNKINAAYALGGIDLLIETVESISGLDVNYYVIVDFKGFEKMVDTLGGIDIDVEKKLVDKSLHLDLSPGYQHLTGHEALLYVRFRHDDEGDFGRIRRQQQFLTTLVDKGKQLKNIFRLPALAGILAENTTTNMTLREMIGYGNFMRSLEKEQIETVMLPGEPKNIDRVSYVVLDDAEMERIFYDMRNGISITATEDAQVENGDINIEVLNGAGVQGLASSTKDTLEALGFTVTKTDNADRNDHEQTLIYSNSQNAEKAKMVHDAFRIGAVIVDDNLKTTADVEVVVGKDYANLIS